MTACERRETDLALHATGDLAPGRAARLEAHLAACPTCQGRLRAFERHQALLGALGTEPMADEGLQRVRAGVRRTLMSTPAGGARWGRRWLPVVTGAASVVVAAAALLVQLRPSPAPLSASGPVPSPAGVAAEPAVAPPVEEPAPPSPSPTTPPRRVAAAVTAAPPRVESAPPALSPEEADQLVKALVYVSQLERLPRADEEEPEEAHAPTAQLARFETDDPNVVIYWLMDSNGGSS
jgi:anti-sigma factor RsiW